MKMMLFKTNYLNVVLMASSQPDLQFQNEFKHSLLFFSNAVNETQLPGLLPPWPPARINEHKGRKGVFQMKERG